MANYERFKRQEHTVAAIKEGHSPGGYCGYQANEQEVLKLIKFSQELDWESPQIGNDQVYRLDQNKEESIYDWVKTWLHLPLPYKIDLISFKFNRGEPLRAVHVDKSHRKIEEGCLKEVLYKTIVFPLWTDGPVEICKTVLMKQYYYHHNVYFAHGKVDARLPYGLNDYGDIHGLSKEGTAYKSKSLSHIPTEYLRGLDISQEIPWVIGKPHSFDRTQLHTANNYWESGVKQRLFIQIQTLRDMGYSYIS